MADDVTDVSAEDCKHQALQHGANVFEMFDIDRSNCRVYRCHPDYINFTETSNITDMYFVGMYFNRSNLLHATLTYNFLPQLKGQPYIHL